MKKLISLLLLLPSICFACLKCEQLTLEIDHKIAYTSNYIDEIEGTEFNDEGIRDWLVSYNTGVLNTLYKVKKKLESAQWVENKRK